MTGYAGALPGLVTVTVAALAARGGDVGVDDEIARIVLAEREHERPLVSGRHRFVADRLLVVDLEGDDPAFEAVGDAADRRMGTDDDAVGALQVPGRGGIPEIVREGA